MEICQLKDIDEVIPMQPEVAFFNNHRWKIKVIWSRIDGVMKGEIKRNIKNIHSPCNWPKRSRWLQGYMIFYMTYKLYGLSRSFGPICDSIQRIIREISAIESLKTSCLLDRKWHKKGFFYEVKFIIFLPLLKQVWPRFDSK